MLSLFSLLFVVGARAQDVIGCDGATFRARDRDLEALGPNPVGYREFIHEGITTAVWYPGVPGSEALQEEYIIDIRKYLPVSQQGAIPDDKAPFQYDTNMYDGLPLDEEYGPYPVIFFVHGTAAWKEQSNPTMVHWASRGFVVFSQDQPGLFLGDFLSSMPFVCPDSPLGNRDLTGNTQRLYQGLLDPVGTNYTFLSGFTDNKRIALGGHSAGANAVDGMITDIPDVQVVLSWAGSRRADESPTLQTNLKLGGLDDDVVSFASTRNSYGNSVRPKRLVGLQNTGHLFCTNICDIKNADGDRILDIAQDHGVCGAALAGFLFDCTHDLPDETAWNIVNTATSAVLEEVLHCQFEGEDPFRDFMERYPDVRVFEQDL